MLIWDREALLPRKLCYTQEFDISLKIIRRLTVCGNTIAGSIAGSQVIC